MTGIAAVIGLGVGGFLGFWAGVFLADDWGDLGDGALYAGAWGGTTGAVIGAFVGAQLAG